MVTFSELRRLQGLLCSCEESGLGYCNYLRREICPIGTTRETGKKYKQDAWIIPGSSLMLDREDNQNNTGLTPILRNQIQKFDHPVKVFYEIC